MNKNKKVLLTIITILVAAILFSNNANAKTIMFLNCQYSNCSGNACEISSFIRYTDNNGNINWAGVYSMGQHDGKFDLIKRYINIKNSSSKDLKIVAIGLKDMNNDYCWLSDDNKDAACSKDTSIGWKGKQTYYDFFAAGICPTSIRYSNDLLEKIDEKLVPIGKEGIATTYTLYLENPKYIIYQYEDKDGNLRIVAEGYNSDGKYCIIGPDLKVFHNDEIMTHQNRILLNSINEDKNMSFFDVDTNFNNLIISGRGASTSLGDKMPKCKNYDDCKENHGYEVLLDSNDSNGAIKKAVANWLSTNNEKFKSFEKISKIANDKTFINEIEDLNDKASSGKSYSFKNITSEEMISKLEEGYEGLELAYSSGKTFVDCATDQETSPTSSFTSCEIYQNYLHINKISELIKDSSKRNNEHMINQNYIVEMIVNQVKNEMQTQMTNTSNAINLLDASRDLKKYTSMFYYAISYMKSNPNVYFLNAGQIQKINDLSEKFEKLVTDNELDIYPITNCEELLGEDLINKLNSYMNIIKIAVPIILIGFGIIEFTKAMFSGSEDDMKKAQQKFIKRLIIAVLIFFAPILVNFLLTIANKVWTIITPNSCGIK